LFLTSKYVLLPDLSRSAGEVCVTCVVWGFCGDCGPPSFLPVARCVVCRGERHAAGVSPGSATCLVGAVKDVRNRGFGRVGTLRQGAWQRRGLPAGPYPVALIVRRLTAMEYDPGLRRPGPAPHLHRRHVRPPRRAGPQARGGRCRHLARCPHRHPEDRHG